VPRGLVRILVSLALGPVFAAACNDGMPQSAIEHASTQRFVYHPDSGIKPSPRTPMDEQSLINLVHAFCKETNPTFTPSDARAFVAASKPDKRSNGPQVVAETLNAAFAKCDVQLIASVVEGEVVFKHNLPPAIEAGSTISETREGLMALVRR